MVKDFVLVEKKNRREVGKLWWEKKNKNRKMPMLWLGCSETVCINREEVDEESVDHEGKKIIIFLVFHWALLSPFHSQVLAG